MSAQSNIGPIAKMAFRNLSRHKKATFLLGGVIAFGVLIVSLTQGFTGSVMANVSTNMANLMAGHLFISGEEKLDDGRKYEIIRDDAVLMEALKASGVNTSYITRRAQFQGTLIFESTSLMDVVAGVDFSKETFLTKRMIVIDGSLEGMSNPQGIILSEKMAKDLKVGKDYEILVQLKTITGQQNLGRFTVVAIVRDSGAMAGSSMPAYGNIAYVNQLLSLPEGSYQQLGLFIPDIKTMESDGAKFYKALKEKAQVFPREAKKTQQQKLMSMLNGDKEGTWKGVRYRFETLNDKLSGLQDLVSGINVASWVILLVLFAIIMVGISNTFRMIMLDRIREIGTMRALGVQRDEIRTLFLSEALFLSLGGAIVGLCLAGLVMLFISMANLGMDSFIAILLRNGHISFSLKPLTVLINIIIIGGLTLLAAYFPARAAARLDPASALRTSK